jgi:hypothetical protein
MEVISLVLELLWESIPLPSFPGSNSLPHGKDMLPVTNKEKEAETKGDRWGLNPQPLEPQSRALPIELRSPRILNVSSV